MDNLYYTAYEIRYKKAYEAGADYWGHTPDDEELTSYLSEWVRQHNLEGKRIIEFACGEGASGVILSGLGCMYHGVDISPSAVNKAANTLKNYPNAAVSLLDMVSRKVDGIYDAALDVMGFHMLVADPDRLKFLKNALSCLKNNAPMFFFREQYSEDANDGFINAFDEWLSITNHDYVTPRQLCFQKDGKDIGIQLPFVPGRSKTKDGYAHELSQSGFVIDSFMEMSESRKLSKSISIYAHKP
jgi:predicted RNA methylase